MKAGPYKCSDIQIKNQWGQVTSKSGMLDLTVALEYLCVLLKCLVTLLEYLAVLLEYVSPEQARRD